MVWVWHSWTELLVIAVIPYPLSIASPLLTKYMLDASIAHLSHMRLLLMIKACHQMMEEIILRCMAQPTIFPFFLPQPFYRQRLAIRDSRFHEWHMQCFFAKFDVFKAIWSYIIFAPWYLFGELWYCGHYYCFAYVLVLHVIGILLHPTIPSPPYN